MATRAVALVDNPNGGRVQIYRWSGLLNGDDGAPLPVPKGDVSVHVRGTFGAAGNVIIEGKNSPDAGTYALLRSPDSVTLATITAETLKQVLEVAYMIRPRVSAGDGTTSLIVDLIVVGP